MSFIKSFWKFVRNLQSFVGTFLFFIVMMVVLCLVLGNLFFSSDDKKFKQENSALVINFKGTIVEQEEFSSDPYEQILSGGNSSNTRLRDVTRAIELAAQDDNISTLVLNFSRFGGAYPSKLHYIGSKLEKFKESGKKVISYGSLYDQSAYLLASFSDEIYMHPQGTALLYGYGGYQNYYFDFLEKIKAEVQVFRVGKYKSAMEPFMRRDMSDEAREESLILYGDLWDAYIAQISKQRSIDENVLREGINNADQLLAGVEGDLGQLALQNSLIDGLKTRAEWVAYMQELVGVGENDDSINQIDFISYLSSKNGIPDFDKNKNIIAVIYAVGTIMDGDMPQGTVGGETLSRQLRQARLDDDVKAVVLRVDTPGGSSFASEIIRQEVLLLKKAGKPVIASFASVAASGGYWISANADEIWASPTTITGSIGIFGAIPNIQGTLAAIGITIDGVGTTPLVTAGINMPLPPKVKNIIQSNIENGYDRFLKLVAEGRNMTVEQVNEIAQGRVWSGAKAFEIGLVDHLGNIDQAIEAAAARADLTNYKVTHWEDEMPFKMQIIAKLIDSDGSLSAFIRAHKNKPEQVLIRQITRKLSLFSKMNDPHHSYVLCVDCMADFNPKY
ncbi:MAG: signal peptide peptidase SppA [Emcibacteraceae bacterium]|nr:signal peptide peptidase SppA [Emcibacteraceae bacterium]